MWEMMTNLIPGRQGRSNNTMTAMLIGAGIGIAAWETLRRNNTLGAARNQLTNMATSATQSTANTQS